MIAPVFLAGNYIVLILIYSYLFTKVFCDKLYRRFCKTDAAAKALEPCLSFWVDCSGRLKPFGNLGSLLDLLRLILSPLDFWLVVWNIFSRMRSKGSRFTLGVWGLRVCSLEVAFTVATVHNRPQPFATVRNRSLRFAWQAWHFVTFRRVL